MYFLFFSFHACVCDGVEMVGKHVIELKNIDAISLMDQFRNYLQWFHMLAIRQGVLTKRLFFVFLRTACASIMVSILSP